MHIRYVVVIAMLVVSGLLTLGNSNFKQGDCDTEAWQQDAGYKLTDFLDAYQLALATSRISLAPVVIEMNRSYRGFERSSHPACMDEAVNKTLEGMAGTVIGFESFMRGGDAIPDALRDARELLWQAADLFNEMGVSVDSRLKVLM